MLSWKTQTNLVNAESYFDEHLRVGEYYNQDDQNLGRWQGFGAERLGLRNAVQRDDFLQLCQNLNPVTGERLTQRHKTTRVDSGHEVANRRIFYDFTFSPPRSATIHHALWTRICTLTAFSSMPRMMTRKAVGRRWTTLKCSRPRNSWRMCITMNSP